LPWSQFVIYDVSDPTSPIIVNSVYSYGGGLSIYVSGKYAYIVDDNELQIIDVSNPYFPIETDDISCGGSQDVYVSGKYAYVTGALDNGVEILDISDPTNPTHVESIDDSACDAANGDACELEGARGIYVSGRYAYVSAPYCNSLGIIDISPLIVIVVIIFIKSVFVTSLIEFAYKLKTGGMV